MPDWLERELRRELAPVEAPEALWNSVQGSRYSERKRALRSWPVAAILTVALAIGTIEFHLRVDPVGRVLGGRIPAQEVVAERLGS